MDTTSTNVWFSKIVFFVGLIVFVSCSNSEEKNYEKENSHTSGKLRVLSDDTFEPLLKTTKETFEALYPNATIVLEYYPQEKAFAALLEGKTDVVIAGRKLSAEEEKIVKLKGLNIKTNQIASDALVFIASKETDMDVISEKMITEIFSGKEQILLVCDKSSSGNLVYLKERFNLPVEIKNIYAAGSDSAVIEYITTHPKAIGIIGMALVSDRDDKKVIEKLSKVKPLSIQYSDTTGKEIVSYPVQEELAIKKYPFIRPIFVINLDGSLNIGTGFANFLASERGQRIILKSGLIPYQLPGRELIIVK